MPAAIHIYPPDRQGRGQFDGGRITETKPIGFPGEGSAVQRVGPLFYWAWATSTGPATITMHPHKGFEIASYVMAGIIGHADTGGHATRVETGGLQVMQTGSGISHEERTFDVPTDFFQIWFEPHLGEAVKRPPVYFECTEDQFPAHDAGGVQVRAILGGPAPAQLVADVRMERWDLEPDAKHTVAPATGRSSALVVMHGRCRLPTGHDETSLSPRDFVVVEGNGDGIPLTSDSEGAAVMTVNVPTTVDYPLLAR